MKWAGLFLIGVVVILVTSIDVLAGKIILELSAVRWLRTVEFWALTILAITAALTLPLGKRLALFLTLSAVYFAVWDYCVIVLEFSYLVGLDYRENVPLKESWKIYQLYRSNTFTENKDVFWYLMMSAPFLYLNLVMAVTLFVKRWMRKMRNKI